MSHTSKAIIRSISFEPDGTLEAVDRVAERDYRGNRSQAACRLMREALTVRGEIKPVETVTVDGKRARRARP